MKTLNTLDSGQLHALIATVLINFTNTVDDKILSELNDVRNYDDNVFTKEEQTNLILHNKKVTVILSEGLSKWLEKYGDVKASHVYADREISFNEFIDIYIDDKFNHNVKYYYNGELRK
jgi:hypothetical protein